MNWDIVSSNDPLPPGTAGILNQVLAKWPLRRQRLRLEWRTCYVIARRLPLPSAKRMPLAW